MDHVQRQALDHLLDEKRTKVESILSLSKTQQAEVLDVAMDYWEYAHPSSTQSRAPELTDVIEDFRMDLLKSRYALKVSTTALEPTVPLHERPDWGHDSARFGLGIQRDFNANSTALIWQQRFAHHDILDPGYGYPSDSTIEFMNIRAESLIINEGQKLATNVTLQKVAIIDIHTIRAFDQREQAWSWRAGVGLTRDLYKSCHECLAAYGRLGIGVGQKFFANTLVASAEILGDVLGTTQADTNYLRLQPRWEFLLLGHLSHLTKTMVSIQKPVPMNSSDESKLLSTLGWRHQINQNLALDLQIQRDEARSKTVHMVSFFRYY